MKKAILLLFAVFSLNVFPQGCDNPLQFCSGINYNLPLATNTTAPTGPNYGCLSTQPNPAFFYFQINTPGILKLHVSGSAAADVDAICWGPFTSPFLACSNSQLSNSGNIVDCSYSTSATETITINSGVAGQFYILCVTNYSNMAQNLNLSSDSISTASTYCDSTLCNISTPASICFISTNDSLQNKIYFNHTAIGLKGTIVYRQNASSMWDSIGYVPSSQPDEFTDRVANPNQQAYTYCIAQVDSCSNMHAKSPSHRTIFLQSSLGTGTQINLSWTAYLGVAVGSYYIYRGASPSTLSLINQVSSSTLAYTDLTPPAGINYYKVAFASPSCTSNSPFDTLVGSNYKTATGTTALVYLNNAELFTVYPNPTQKNINVYNYEIAKSIEVTDLLGNTVLFIKAKNNLETINIENLAKGVYLIKVVNSKGTFCKKFLIE